jgi:hypothetical protein
MSPTVFRYKNYRFFFFSREEMRIHIHVYSSEGEAKFWIEPRIEIVNNSGFSKTQISEIKSIIKEHLNDIQDAWDKHFGN